MAKMMISARCPCLSVTANLNNKDLGTATNDVQKAIESIWVNCRAV